MKIGVMTWWRNNNYGGFLQGLALQTFLLKRGYDVEMVRFTYPEIEFPPSSPSSVVWPSRTSGAREFFLSLKAALRDLVFNSSPFARMSRLRKTQRILDRYIRASPREYASLAELNEAHRYDAIVVGSDQVWTTRWNDPAFSYLLRGIDDSVRKVSYAASVGAETVHPHEAVFAEALTRFDAISVRERTNVAELERLSGKKVEWVVDPTQLLSADEWRDLLDLKAVPDEPHVTFYSLSPFEGRVSELVRLAKERKCKIHILSNVEAFRRVGGGWVRYLVARARIFLSPHLSLRLGADAREWVQDVSTAEFVLSDSFHALMFATIFGREVRVEFPNRLRSAMSARITDFQYRAGELDAWRERSKAWLLDAVAAARNMV